MTAKRKSGNQAPTEVILNDVNRCVDPQLWQAIAGKVQMPEVDTHICYFPQGHAEHACEMVNFSGLCKIQSFIPCRVVAIDYMADPETDEVYAKLRFNPLRNNDVRFEDDDVLGMNVSESKDKLQSYVKTLTQSDASNGGGFSCPRFCAENLFPPLDYSGNPPAQDLCVKDVHGRTYSLKHVYRGTPKRHLLTTGWSDFVTDKKVIRGDSIVFMKAENGDLHVGIRRTRREPLVDEEFTHSLEEDGDKVRRSGKRSEILRVSDGVMGKGKVKAQEVIEAVSRASNMQPFDVVYYPRSNTPEYFVKTSLVRTALQTRWCPGMRFKMAFETEETSRISVFIGTIASVQIGDPAWPDSFWRLLQVTWDEQELLKNVKSVNPWQIELVSNMPSIPLAPFVPPRKKLRLTQHTDFPIDYKFAMPNYSSNFLSSNVPLLNLPENIPVGMQGARHGHLDLSLSEYYLNKLHLGLTKPNFQPYPMTVTNNSNNSQLQKTNKSSTQSSSEKEEDHEKPPQLVLFGQKIQVEKNTSNNISPTKVGG